MRWIGLLPAILLTGCSPPENQIKSDLDWVQGVRTVTVAPGATAEHIAWCSSDRWAIAGGFALPSNPQSFAVTSSMPFAGKWRVTVRNVTATPQPLELIVYVGCFKV